MRFSVQSNNDMISSHTAIINESVRSECSFCKVHQNVNRVLEFRGMFRVLQFAQKCMAWNIVKNEGFDTFISKFSDIKHD